MKIILKYILVIFVSLLILAAFVSLFEPSEKTVIPISELVSKINRGEVENITVKEDLLEIKTTGGELFETKKETSVSALETLANLGADSDKLSAIQVEIKDASGFAVVLKSVLPIILPFLLILLIFWFMFNQAQKGSMQALSFGRSKARLANVAGKKKIMFKDVAGLMEAKEEISEVVEFLRDPQKFHRLGARIPRGIMLVGSPGTGKTLLAKAVANEANVPFYFVSGSEFVEMFVGIGASVTGDTPVLIKNKEEIALMPIQEFVNKYYKEGEADKVKIVDDIWTLGFDKKETGFRGFKNMGGKFFFGKSSWKKVSGVYRHKSDKIYEIDYLGGVVKATGDHSVFIREKNYITAKKVSELKPGNVLVGIPFKTRGEFIPSKGTKHSIRSFEFDNTTPKTLTVWEEDEDMLRKYDFALAYQGLMSQQQISSFIGVPQMSISEWQRYKRYPRKISPRLHEARENIPQKINITPEFMRLLGYYLAEGRTTPGLTQFVFNLNEERLHSDCIKLIKSTFNIDPKLEPTQDNTLRININSSDIASLFTKLCNTGSHNKQLPNFVWELDYSHFLELLRGYGSGDGYITKEGKLAITSVSKQLIRELSWLCSMHGIGVGVREGFNPDGIVIKTNPIKGGPYWTLIIGKTSNPFTENNGAKNQYKKPVIKEIREVNYNDYVYDLCGCENEAFFGGEKPILLHNSRVSNTFELAKKTSPSIIFIDEIDAVGRHRGAGLGGGHDEREQTLNQILVEMDGFDTNDSVIIVAATNRPDILDPALLRPGRFDRRIILDEPSMKERVEILKIHSLEKPLAGDVDLKVVAERTPGFSGADLANLVNEAAILAARKNQKDIKQLDIFQSIEKVILGPERRSHILSKKEKEVTAYHEAGHALVAVSLPHSDPVHKISIISRGRAGGYTLKLPSEDKHLRSKGEFESELAVLLGGYTAEKTIFKDTTTGATNDLKVASDLARKMVTQFGMSDKLGPITYGEKDELVFLGKEIGHTKNYSETVAFQIDSEVKKLILKSLTMAKKVLTQKIDTLHKIAKELIIKETLEQKEFYALVG